MKRAEEYKNLAEQVRHQARTAYSKQVAAEWDHLADCYLVLARQAERNEQVAASSGERSPNN